MKIVNNILFFVSVLLLLPNLCNSQTINSLKLNERLQYHVKYLASDSLEGREACEKGQFLAAKYISRYFDLLGLTPYNEATGSYEQEFYLTEIPLVFQPISSTITRGKYAWGYLLQKYDTARKISDNLTLYVKQKVLDTNSLYLVLENQKSKSFDKSDVFGQITEIRSRNKNIKKFIIVVSPKSARSYVRELNRYYPALLIGENKIQRMFRKDYDFTDSLLNRNTFFLKKFLNDNADITFIFSRKMMISNLFLKEEWQKIKSHGIADSVSVPIYCYQSKYTQVAPLNRIKHQTSNVVGKIEGSEKKDEVIIVCAHYDHIGVYNSYANGSLKKIINYGADDNASGTSAVMEIARMIKDSVSNGKRPKRTIYFVAFSAEEKGLCGSEYFARNLSVPIENIKAVLNLDMIGRTNKHFSDTTNYCYTLPKCEKRKFKKIIKEESKSLGIDTDRFIGVFNWLLFTFGSDHFSFVKRDVPAIIFTTDSKEDYHTPRDTWNKLNYNRMSVITSLINKIAWKLSNE